MSFRIQKGKPKFAYHDSFDAQSTLSPIIAAWIRNFLETLRKVDTKDGAMGIPNSVCKELCKGDDLDDEKLEEAKQVWFTILEKMLYAFEDEAPEYNGEIHITKKSRDEFGNVVGAIQISDEQEWEQHKKDLKAHADKVQEGLDLFAKYYDDLWW